MDPAIELLDQRVASGEISLEEHGRLKALLTAQRERSEASEPPSPSAPSFVNTEAGNESITRTLESTQPTHGGHTWLWVLGGVVTLVVLLAIGQSTGGLSLGQLRHLNGQVVLTLANTSSTLGDVILFVEDSGIRKCEHIVAMRPGKVENLSFGCEMQAGARFEVYAVWAEGNDGLAAVAKRVTVNW